MAALRPREIRRRATIWNDNDGKPWLVVVEFTMVAGRLECVGMEMRSFLRDDILEDVDPASDRPARLYSGYWEGEPEKSGEASDDAWMMLGWDLEECRSAAEDLATSRPRPLRATVLRQLPLADVFTRMRRQAFPIREIPMKVLSRYLDGGDMRSEGWWKEQATVWAPRMRRGGRVARYNRSDLEQVAAIYSDAFRSGSGSPTKDVAEQLGITRNQAAKLVMKCRAPEVGLLDPVKRRTAGGVPSEPQAEDDPH